MAAAEELLKEQPDGEVHYSPESPLITPCVPMGGWRAYRPLWRGLQASDCPALYLGS